MKNNIQETLATWLDSLIQPLATLHLVVAYSGGRDSHVLLHALAALKQHSFTFELSAIHVNHGLQHGAHTWALHCQQTAASYGVHCEVISLQLMPQKGESVEEVARLARYGAFKTLQRPNRFVLTAHTQDDQAESVILQLMRGAGIKGLSGIAPLVKLGDGQMARPLLCVSRNCVAEYAAEHQLKWVEDPSNQDPRFARNFLRQAVFAPLQTYFPGFIGCVSRSAEHIASMQTLLDDYLLEDFSRCLMREGMLDLTTMKRFSANKQMAILRKWLEHHHIRSPSTRVLTSILDQALNAKIDAKVSIRLGEFTISRYQHKLYCYRHEASPLHAEIDWDLNTELCWLGQYWQATKAQGAGIVLANSEQRLTVKLRKGGEKCRLQGEKITRSLKKILQHRKIPFWERAVIPLFYQGEQLVSIGESLICEGSAVSSPETFGWVIKRVR